LQCLHALLPRSAASQAPLAFREKERSESARTVDGEPEWHCRRHSLWGHAVPDEHPPDPSALPKPAHEPPHDRFFEEGEEPPARYDLPEEAAYHFDSAWTVTIRDWSKVALTQYLSFLKSAAWVSVPYGPGWLVAWYPVFGIVFMFYEAFASMWLSRRSLEHLTGTKISVKRMNAYGATLYLDLLAGLLMYIGFGTAIFCTVGIGRFLEQGEDLYAGLFGLFVLVDVFVTVSVKGRLTRFARFLIVDQGIGTVRAMQLSWRMWRGHFWPLFFIELLTFAAFVAGSAPFGVGLALVLPFTTLFWSAAYLSATGAPVRSLLHTSDSA
jgi:hypothetical protein